jgi:hypothetical protein
MLIKAITGPNYLLRCDAFNALCDVPLSDEHAAAALPEAVNLLVMGDRVEARAASFKRVGMRFIKHLGSAAAPEARRLAEIMINDPALRDELTEFLVNLGPSAAAATEVLERAQDDKDSQVKASAFRILGAIRSASK